MRQSRREILVSGLSLAISGCSGQVFRDLLTSQNSLLFLSPWSEEVCRELNSAFQAWRKSRQLNDVKIIWLPVDENELQSTGLLTGLPVDALVGCHKDLHRKWFSSNFKTYDLEPVRRLFIVPDPHDAAGSVKTSEKLSGWTSTSDINAWGRTGTGLQLGSANISQIANVYLQAIWDSAPDASSGYARWVLLCRFLDGIRPDQDQLVLESPDDSKWGSRLQPLLTSQALNRAMGIEADESQFWPESISFSAQNSDLLELREQFLRFLRETDRLRTTTGLTPASVFRDSFRRDLATIVTHDLRDKIREVWRVIEPAGGELRTRVETYLTELPPWPPASVTSLQKRRGFEFVVALIEQVAANGDQRTWLVQNFQEAPNPLQMELLDQALDGSFLKNIRFRAWIRAEWKAWINQRCRRAIRYVLDGEELNRSETNDSSILS